MGLEKAPNARDLGGYVGAGGRRVRRGLLYRADALHRLSDADLAALASVKLSCLIDMRSPHEVQSVGQDRLPTPAPAQLISLPIHDPEEKIFVSIGVLMGRATGDLPFGDGADAAHLMRRLYRWFVSSPLARRTFAAAVRIIADGEALPLMFHCTAGKDRTGWLSAIVLTALGVDRDQVTADYLVTEQLNAASNEYLLTTVLAARIPDPLAALPMLQARREYVEAAFAEADAIFGGMDGYLRDGLELDESTLATLRSNLLEP